MSYLLNNRAIVNKLSELVEKYPDSRFGQILLRADVITFEDDCTMKDPWEDEPKDIWHRMCINEYCFPNNNFD